MNAYPRRCGHQASWSWVVGLTGACVMMLPAVSRDQTMTVTKTITWTYNAAPAAKETNTYTWFLGASAFQRRFCSGESNESCQRKARLGNLGGECRSAGGQ